MGDSPGQTEPFRFRLEFGFYLMCNEKLFNCLKQMIMSVFEGIIFWLFKGNYIIYRYIIKCMLERNEQAWKHKF